MSFQGLCKWYNVEYGHGGEEMVDDVVVGDSIAMLSQSSIDESIWIMLIDTLPIWSKKHFIYVWGQHWFEGDYVIQMLLYEKSHPSSRSYHLLEDSPLAFVYFHLIVASNFSMPPRVNA
jgi:hypothetical protein